MAMNELQGQFACNSISPCKFESADFETVNGASAASSGLHQPPPCPSYPHSTSSCRPSRTGSTHLTGAYTHAVPSNSVPAQQPAQQMSPATQQPTFQQQLARGAKKRALSQSSVENAGCCTIELNQVTASHDCLSWIPCSEAAVAASEGSPKLPGQPGLHRASLGGVFFGQHRRWCGAGNSPLFPPTACGSFLTVANRTRTTPPPLRHCRRQQAGKSVRWRCRQFNSCCCDNEDDGPEAAGSEADRRAADDEADDDEEADGTSGEILATVCRWVNCGLQCGTNAELVEHVNDVHVKGSGDRKEFVCHWIGCSRNQKPFKALYMLNV
uniref:C2H2-type domain-containing protein n=1 Tax=Macrostomum lignano TaxID=282301 RepID=A0A1I8FH10_9PLAT